MISMFIILTIGIYTGLLFYILAHVQSSSKQRKLAHLKSSKTNRTVTVEGMFLTR